MVRNIVVESVKWQPIEEHSVELVERKGLGHPDTIADAAAEASSRLLSSYYLEKYGAILHHNVDKVLVVGGQAAPRFGGGEVLQPIYIIVSGRATTEVRHPDGRVERIPIGPLILKAVKGWIKEHFRFLDPETHVIVDYKIGHGSADLVGLFELGKKTVPLANDTSVGVGFAPFSTLERLVLETERLLNSKQFKERNPEVGEDIKVMGVRRNDEIDITVACAFVDRYIRDLNDYVEKREKVRKVAESIAKRFTERKVNVHVNTGDDVERGNVYITVTGTSSEAGDDGEVGRGNRANGLITPYRPMSLEAAAGKNPITHVGKLYNITATQIANTVVEEIPEVEEAYCYIVSQIGKPVSEPLALDVKVRSSENVEMFRPKIERIAMDLLASIKDIWKKLVAKEITVY